MNATTRSGILQRSGRTMAPQRGVATLMVVMALFFIISLVAAYASRNLIFEQRTSANQYRSTQAFEAAEAGIEWALAMLNAGRIDAACQPTTNGAFDDFRSRYLTAEPVLGTFVRKQWLDASGALLDLRPTCVSSGVGWTCSCPSNGLPVVTVPAGPGTFPAFSIRFYSGSVPGTLAIRSYGCTAAETDCLNTGRSTAGDAGTVVTVDAALARAMPTSPAAAATVRNNLNLSGTWHVANADPGTNGFTVHAGGSVTAPGAVLETIPGAPSGQTVLENDSTLAALSADQMFNAYFGVQRETFKRQPSTVVMTCGGGCGNNLRDAVANNPGRPVWVEGDLTIETGVNIGSAAQPALIMATGNINITAPTARVFGVIYSQAASWSSTGSGTVQGALLAEGNLTGSSAPTLIFDANIVNQVRLTYGPIIRMPGGWSNF